MISVTVNPHNKTIERKSVASYEIPPASVFVGKRKGRPVIGMRSWSGDKIIWCSAGSVDSSVAERVVYFEDVTILDCTQDITITGTAKEKL